MLEDIEVIPLPPEDLVGVSYIQREIPKGPDRGKIFKMANGYFHLRESCIAKELAGFKMLELIVTDQVKAELSLSHHRFLRRMKGDSYVFVP